MKDPIRISSNLITHRSFFGRLRKNRDYNGIARRAINSQVTYDTEIDISAVIIK